MQEHVELWRVAHEELVFLGICRFYEKGAMQTKDSMRKTKDAMRKTNLPCCMCCGSDNVEEQDSPRLEMDSLDADGDGTITLVGLITRYVPVLKCIVSIPRPRPIGPLR